MPSPVPGFNPRPAPDAGAAVQPPAPVSAQGCVACLLEDVYAPLEVAYTYDGVSFCAKHVKDVITRADPIILRGVILRP